MAQKTKTFSLIWIVLSFFAGLFDKCPEHSHDSTHKCHHDHDKAPLWLRPAVRLDRTVHHLNYGGVLGLVNLCEFILLCEQFVEKLVVLHVAQAGEVVETAAT